MGTAASAQASEAVQAASAEEVQAYLDQLSPEDKSKLLGAVADAEAPAPADADGGAAAEAAAPAEEAAGGDAAAEAAAPAEEPKPADAEAEAAPEVAAAEGGAGGPAEEAKEAAPAEDAAGTAPPEAATAPFLAEYFEKVKKRTADLIGDQEKLLALAMDPEAKKKLTDESKAWFETDAKPLLEKSFKHHDTRTNDVLDQNEAAVFFKHLVHEETEFAKALSALTIEAGVKMSMGMMESLSEEQREQIKPQLEEQMKQKIDAAQTEVQKKEDNYKANRAEFDAAAFKVLDTSGDGSIQLVEFIAAFEPDTAKNLEMHLALGYITKEEVEAQKKREEEAKEQAGGCAQQ